MLFFWFRQARRRRLADRPFPAAWEAILEEHVPWAAQIPAEEQESFMRQLKVFFWEKHWVGAAGLEIDDEIRVVVSAAAARIARGLPLEVYDRLSEVVVYPRTFVDRERFQGELTPTVDNHMLGQATHWGTVVLSWDAVRHGITDPHDGHDTALHEFAHALDFEDGRFDGTPQLHEGRDYAAWARVLGAHFARLKRGRLRSVLDEYGTKNEAEFFAVATEAFFERPRTMRRKTPALYKELRRYFRVDPAAAADARQEERGG